MCCKNKKLLHERLRDEAKYEESNKSEICLIEEEGYSFLISPEEARVFADDIERYYIPRPRFEDGEPIKIGDEVDNGIIKFIDVSSDGSWSVSNEKAEELYIGYSGEPMKRPAPEVLDADGVPIRVGDTVFNIDDNGKCGIVDSIRKVYLDTDKWSVLCVDDEGSIVFDKYSENLTHREPDSVNRLLDDMKSYSSEHFMPDSDTKKAINGWIERIAELKLAETA